MALVILNEGKTELVSYTLGLTDASARDWKVALYQNNHAPVQTDTFSAFTLSTFTGSTPFSLDVLEWGAPTIIANRGVSVYTPTIPLKWTNTGVVQTAYGYIVYDIAGFGYWAELFATPRIINPGESLELILQFRGTTE